MNERSVAEALVILRICPPNPAFTSRSCAATTHAMRNEVRRAEKMACHAV